MSLRCASCRGRGAAVARRVKRKKKSGAKKRNRSEGAAVARRVRRASRVRASTEYECCGIMWFNAQLLQYDKVCELWRLRGQGVPLFF